MVNHGDTDNTSCNNNNVGVGDNTFYCESCDMTFNKKAGFDKHLLTSKHLEPKGFVKGFEKEIPADTTNTNTNTNTNPTTGFTCEKCNKNYKYKASFFTHAKTCGKDDLGVLQSTPLQLPSAAAHSNTSSSSSATAAAATLTNDTTILLVNEIATMMKTMSQIVTTLDLTIVTLNKMYNKN